MMPVKLPVLFYTEAGEKLHEAGMPVPKGEYAVHEVIFFHIDCIQPGLDSVTGGECCVVVSSGYNYTVPMPMDEAVHICKLAAVWMGIN